MFGDGTGCVPGVTVRRSLALSRSSSWTLLTLAIFVTGFPIGVSAPAWASGSSGKIHEITFDDVSLELEKDEPFEPAMLTDRVKELDKEVVRVRGWILPASVFQQRGIRSFVLVRDNMECCFGPGAALDDCMIVELEAGKSTDFTTRPVAVEGVFTVREFKDPAGKHYAIYHLRGRSVK
jgi:hypothetical protein